MVFDVMQNLQRLFRSGGFHLYLLESALQCSVLLDGVAVFVESRSTDTLYGAPCQGGFQDVGSIHRTGCGTSANHGVYLVDEDDHFLILFQFLDELAQAFLKLSAIFRASHNSCQIECHQSFAEEHGRALPTGNHLCQSLDDGTLSDTGFAYQYGVVLLSSAQYLHHALYLTLTAYNGVELIVQGLLCQVGREIVEHWCLRLLLLLGLCGRLLVACRRLMLAASCRLLFLLVVFIGHTDAVLDAQQRQCIFVIHIVHF